jgi:hypothetical protein
VTILTAAAAAVLITLQRRSHRRTMPSLNRALHVVCIAAIALSLVFFFQLDTLVHGDLYRFGLQMDDQWTIKYWLYSRTLYALEGISAVLASIALALNFGSRKARIDTARLIAGAMLTGGLIVLALSILYNLSILAFVGLGLTFWGAVLNYIQGEEYVKKPLFDTISSQTLSTLRPLLQELNFQGPAIYLPPEYFSNPNTTKAYIPRGVNSGLPDPKRLEEQGDQLFSTHYDGILLTPPGAEIARLFEESLGTSFTQADLASLTQKLPKIVVEDLEIARSMELKVQANRVLVRMAHTAFPDFSLPPYQPENTTGSLGSHLSGAVACALAKTTGKPVIIHRQHADTEGETIEVEYHLLEEEAAAA